MKKDRKNSKDLERHLKGVANHRRIDILFLIEKHEGITLEKIAELLDCNIKTISEHTKKLSYAGLINKSHKGLFVIHNLSPYGKNFIKFLSSF